MTQTESGFRSISEVGRLAARLAGAAVDAQVRLDHAREVLARRCEPVLGGLDATTRALLEPQLLPPRVTIASHRVDVRLTFTERRDAAASVGLQLSALSDRPLIAARQRQKSERSRTDRFVLHIESIPPVPGDFP